jgi:hypothetical protein
MPKIELTVRYKTPKGEPGSDIDLGGRVYAFRPDAAGRHVADVDDPAHAARLLSFAHYRLLDGDAPVAPPVGLTPSLADLSLAELRALHRAETGTAAHHKAKPATLISRIEQARAARQEF